MDAKDRTIDITAKQFVELVKRARKGDAETQFKVGEYYRKSPGRIWSDGQRIAWDRPLPGNDDPSVSAWVDRKAVQWYRRAAEQNHAPAQYALGNAYATGEGVKKDAELSVEWSAKAAAQDHLPALNAVALDYWKGRGVKRDEEKALEILHATANKGDDLALRNVIYSLAEIASRAESDDPGHKEKLKRAAVMLGILKPEQPDAPEGMAAPRIPYFGHG